MILEADNFYGITTGTMVNRFVQLLYDGRYVIPGNYGRYGSMTSAGILIQSYDFTSPYFMLAVSSSNSIYCGAAFYTESIPGSNVASLFQLRQLTTIHLNVFLNNDGAIRVARGDGTQLATYAIPRYTSHTWNYFEVGAVIDNTNGSVEVRLNNQTIISASSIDTNNGVTGDAFINRVGTYVYGGFPQSAHIYRTTDWYVTNSSGSNSATNGFLGDIRLVSQPPTSAGDNTEFIPFSSTNWSNVDDGTSVDGDATYVSASAVDSMDLFRTANYTGSATTIYGINIKTYARKADAASRQYVSALKSGSSIVYSTTQSLSDTYLFESSTFELNPNTSATWASIADVNGSQIGYKIVT